MLLLLLLQVSVRTMQLLFALARRQKLQEKIAAMCRGDKINNTENRAVLHTALRAAPEDGPIMVDGVNVVDQVHEVLDKVSTQQCIHQHTRYDLSSIMQLQLVGQRLYSVIVSVALCAEDVLITKCNSLSITCFCCTFTALANSRATVQLALL
jgi:Phosphoglucose isomerase